VNKQLSDKIGEEKLNQRQKSFALQTLLLDNKGKINLNQTVRENEGRTGMSCKWLLL
jgi:hypothetical protein